MKKLLTLILLMLLGSTGIKAQTEFISEMCVINVKDPSNLSAVTNNAISKGWKIVTNDSGQYADFSSSAGSGSWYIYLGYKTTTDWTKAVKMVGVLHQTTPANANWTIVPAYSNTSGKGTACTANMNEGKGTPLYLFVKYNNGDASAAVTSLKYVYNGTGSGSVPDYDNSSAPADFLLGTGSSSHIYLQLGYHQHTLDWKSDNASGCHQYCTQCSYASTTIAAHDLTYSSSNLTHQASCSKCDYKTRASAHTYGDTYKWKDSEHCARSCTACGHEQTEEHVPGAWSENSGVANSHISHCQNCHQSMLQKHEYAWTTKNANSCSYLCKVCGHNYYNGAADHVRVLHNDAVSPTCTEGGKTASWHCDHCGYEGQSEATNPLGHSYGATVAGYAATCVSEGRKTYYPCTRCEVLFCDGRPTTEEGLVIPINPNAHQRTLVSTKLSTCTESGYKGHYRCTLCEKYFDLNNQTAEISADDVFLPLHYSTSVCQVRLEPTCTQTGTLTHYSCRECKKVFFRNGNDMVETTKEETVIRALGHATLTIPEMTTSGGTYAEHAQCQRCYEFICPNDPNPLSNDFSGILAGSGTEDDPYLIASQNDLHVMAVRYDLTRNPPFKNRTKQRHFRIDSDFTISGTYLPVGFRASQQVSYRGSAFLSEPFFSDILDGACHTVTFDNATLHPAAYNGGLLGSTNYTLSTYSQQNAAVRNLTVGGQLTAGENTVCLAGICGTASHTSITNCHNYATLHACPTATTSVAGISAGSGSDATFTRCSNHVDLSIEPVHDKYTYLAGIASSSFATVSDCSNTGNLSAVGLKRTSLCGISCSKETTNCRNTGNLTFTSSTRTESSIYGVAKGARNSYNAGNITVNETNIYAWFTSDVCAVCNTADADAHNFFSGTVSAPLVDDATCDPEGSYTTVTLTDGRTDDATISALNTWVDESSTDTLSYLHWMRGTDGLPLFGCEMGDINNDGVISVGDVPTLIGILRGASASTSCWIGDINADGRIDASDVEAVANSILQR